MTTEATSTEEGQAVETTAEVTTQDAPAKDDTGMVGVQADRELETEASEDTSSESLDTPLFDEVAPTEAELTGEEPEKEEAETSKEAEKSSEEKEVEGDKKESEDEAKVEDKKADVEKSEEEEGKAKEETSEVKADKPPAGYVPHAALHQERMERQELARELSGLKQELAEMKVEKGEEGEEAFKVLTDEEFDELVEDDPVEAIKYERQLARNTKAKEVKVSEHKAIEKQQDQDRAIINESVERMTKAVPGLYEEGSSVNKDLADFAIKNGFDSDLLGLMTTPSTIIATSNGDIKPLGDGAASLVEMIHNFYTAAKANDPKTIRTQAKVDAEKELRETITAELMKKFKTPTDTDFKSVGDAPGASGEIPDSSGGFTEAQYANMTPQQRDKLLGA